MRTTHLWRWTGLVAIFAMLLSACGGTPAASTTASGTSAATTGAATMADATSAATMAASATSDTTSATATGAATTGAAPAGNFQIPTAEQGKFNIAMVLLGPHDDGGWSQAHYEGLQYVEKNVPNVHTAYVENVPEGADSEQVFRSLSRKGFNLIMGTSFGYMDPMETVSADFPKITYIHLTGYKTNNTNFGNLFGAMEDIKYLGGMLAGARAKKDGQTKLGYMDTFPIPEELRLGNAFALGMRKTCADCTLDVRGINTWHDPVKEKEGAASLFDAGADVVFTGADTPAPADVAQSKGNKWGITYDWVGGCKVAQCLTTFYWNWGPVYTKLAKGIIDGSYKVGSDYFDADSGALGLYGFMEGQQLTKGESDLPPETIQMVRDTLSKMLAGKFNRFDVFSGPITDNTGKEIVPAGSKLTQADLDQFDPKTGCKYCMHWWAAGVNAQVPPLQ